MEVLLISGFVQAFFYVICFLWWCGCMVSMIHWSWINCCSCFRYSHFLSTHSGLNDYVFDWIMVWTRPIFSNNHRWPSMIWSLLKDADSVSVGRRSQSNYFRLKLTWNLKMDDHKTTKSTFRIDYPRTICPRTNHPLHKYILF